MHADAAQTDQADGQMDGLTGGIPLSTLASGGGEVGGLPPPAEAEPGRRGLRQGIVVFRWAALLWTAVLAAVVDLSHPALAWTTLGILAVWNAGVSFRHAWDRADVRWVDLGLSVALLLTAPAMMREGALAVSGQPFFAVAYPLATVLTWAASAGFIGGVATAALLFVPLAFSRAINGVGFDRLASSEVVDVATGGIYYLMGGGTVGLFARTIDRTAAELRSANDEAALQAERAARLQEREALSREIHDSVLQALALVRKRGRELTARSSVPGRDIGELVQVADDQERALRRLLQRRADEPPEGSVPLRTVLEAATYGIQGVPVTVTTVDPMWLRADDVGELSAAIRQALENVAQHARASMATVFAEEEDGEIVVSIRDDGVGFSFDEERMRRDGKLGLLRSMRGRIEELGGEMLLSSAPGRGTEVEFRLPGPSGSAAKATSAERATKEERS
jgi:signal transduction histidine kinase